jgi:hypothetical protein
LPGHAADTAGATGPGADCPPTADSDGVPCGEPSEVFAEAVSFAVWGGLGGDEVGEPIFVWDAAIQLTAIADEASAGIGFSDPTWLMQPDRDDEFPIANFLLSDHRLFLETGEHLLLPQAPASLCLMVPKEEVCVQPKARTPQVGYTLRAFTHHLALLPAVSEVQTNWYFGSPEQLADRPLNLLLVPFPYRIGGACFSGICRGTPPYFFKIQQQWLPQGNVSRAANKISRFLIGLVKRARREAGTVHGIILPEASLERKLAENIVRHLARETDLELFIAGTLDSSGPIRSEVFGCRFFNHQVYLPWGQSKHHRWRLDRDQIRRYHLGHVLDPEATWWEKIDVSYRTCNFVEFRYGAILTTLVCEDLARIDPVQTVLRSIGPNLVIALLMDGPQLARRWPGRYATVLADDPGSAVLTLTSLGMVKRSCMPGDEEPRQIALWKDSSGIVEELTLPKGSHALLLTISSAKEESLTLDGRSDNGATIKLLLSGVRDIVLPKPPRWIEW